MNTLKMFLLGLGALMLVVDGCKPETLDLYEGTASAMFDGKPWGTIARAGQLPNEPGCWTLHLMQVDKKSGKTIDKISFFNFKFPVTPSKKLLSVGVSIPPDTALFAKLTKFLSDGDVASSPWGVMRAGPSQYLEITRYDSVTQEVEGVFSMTLHKYIYGSGRGFVPEDSVVFTQGTFKTRIQMW